MRSYKVVVMNLPVIRLLGAILLTCVLTSVGEAQRLRDTFRRVKETVVVVRTEQRGEDPALGSGVVISADGKVLTAAHVVQTADKISVQFADNQTSPARVIASSVLADVALLQLTEVPANVMFAKLGNSDEAEVGDEVFVVGATIRTELHLDSWTHQRQAPPRDEDGYHGAHGHDGVLPDRRCYQHGQFRWSHVQPGRRGNRHRQQYFESLRWIRGRWIRRDIENRATFVA